MREQLPSKMSKSECQQLKAAKNNQKYRIEWEDESFDFTQLIR